MASGVSAVAGRSTANYEVEGLNLASDKFFKSTFSKWLLNV